MKNRVYGVVGIKSTLANWNADFSGNPKTTSDGKIFGSDKAFKFPIKKMWEMEGEKVLYVKSYKNAKDNIQARNLAERFNQIFDTDLKGMKQKEEVFKKLFSAIDVLNFGATFAEEKNNISITGAVQVGQGYNKYENSNVEVIDILSPFRDSTKDDAQNSTIGTKIVSDEAHYMYPFTVNPQNYDMYQAVFGDVACYTKEAYESFKHGCLVAATAYNTNSKMGCENEFAIFVECKEDSKLYLANLDQYITFSKNREGKDTIDITELSDILTNHQDEIATIEVYYNKYTLTIKGMKEEYIEKFLF
ncbi:MAG: type I CRISPR-associated protein Cas7 [Clostridia bacterium]|nr:type I CRISPR-associated protein Cas7 [Clostridia bacterium]